MSTENQISENEGNLNPENEVSKNIPIEEKPSKEQENPVEEETVSENITPVSEAKTEAPTPETSKEIENTEEEKTVSTASQENPEEKEETLSPHEGKDINTLVAEMNTILNSENAGTQFKLFHELKNMAILKINQENESVAEDATRKHPQQEKLDTYTKLFKEKYDAYLKQQETEHLKNLEKRKEIVEKLKNLYTHTEPGTNLFKAIREIKEEWKNTGQVSKSQFKILNNDYFHHLNQFYEMLDLNKEYLEQEYSHNLETRKHIIARAKELENEPVVQKALNELQYLHKLWKEEAEPVAEAYRESTWEEFKEISNKIHLRKGELTAQIEEEQNKNLDIKNKIIEEIKNYVSQSGNFNHHLLQNAIKKVEELRSEFIKTGSVPRKISNQNWNEFKAVLKEFNTKKNDFYKSLKTNQQHNLDEKQKLIQIAKDNMNSEDWETVLPLFKKLQEDWKKIGHVPRSMANKVWDEFKGACNSFFEKYREKNSSESGDNWKDNFRQKSLLLEELKNISDEEGIVEKVEALKTAWNNLGKVPRDKIGINTEFNKTLKEKLKHHNIDILSLNEGGLSEVKTTDKARKIKNQITELEAEVAKLENNVSFFSNATAENPLLKDTFDNIKKKKEQIETLKQNLHNIISGEQ